MTTFKRHLKHLVDIVHVTLSKGTRSVTIDTNIPAFIAEETVVIKSTEGDSLQTRTVVFLDSDVVLLDTDEITVNGKTRPIANILTARHIRKNTIHHFEVTLG